MSCKRILAGLPSAFWRCAYCAILCTLFGCATHVQRQLFCVKDPNTGAANYYCLTVYGSSFPGKYNFQAGYFSSAAVDLLRGNMPTIPELDLPVERVTNYDRLLDFIDQDVWQEAKATAPVTDFDILADNESTRVAQAQQAQADIAAQIADTYEKFVDASNSVAQAQARLDLDSQAMAKANTILADLQTNLAWVSTNDPGAIITNLDSSRTRAADLVNGINSVSNTIAAVTPKTPVSTSILHDLAVISTNSVLSQSNLDQVATAVTAAVGSSKAGAPKVAPNFSGVSLLSLSNLNNAVRLGAFALRDFTEGASNATHFALSYTNATAIETDAAAGFNTNAATFLAASKSLISALEPVSNLVSIIGSVPTNSSASTFLIALQSQISQEQTNSQGVAYAITNDNSALLLAKAKQTSIGQKAKSLNLSADFTFKIQSNAALAALDFQTQSINAKMARAIAVASSNAPPGRSVQFSDDYEDRYIKLARLLWFTSLSGADIVSIGMAQSDNPQQFRKLVFWAKSTVGNLEAVSGDVDNIVQQVTTIGDSYKQIAKNRQAAAAAAKATEAARAEAAKTALKGIMSTNVEYTVEGIVNLMMPPSDPGQPAAISQ